MGQRIKGLVTGRVAPQGFEAFSVMRVDADQLTSSSGGSVSPHAFIGIPAAAQFGEFDAPGQGDGAHP